MTKFIPKCNDCNSKSQITKFHATLAGPNRFWYICHACLTGLVLTHFEGSQLNQ